MRILKFLILFIAIFLSNFSYSQSLKNQTHSVSSSIKKLSQDPDLKNAGVSIYVIDLNSGEVIGEYNPDLCLKPASTMKLITTAAALEVLGPKYRFETTLQYDGYIDTAKKTLNGNIYIKGGGDPSLGSKYFESTSNKQFLAQWFDAVKLLNIDTINGRIISDATYYSRQMVPPTWSWEDFGNYFGAGPCGLTIYDNLYTLFFKTASYEGGKTEITKMEPYIPEMTFDNQVVAANISDDQSYIFGQPYTFHRFINGKLPLGKSEYKVKGSMPDPALFAAQEFYSKLTQNGVFIKYPATTLRILEEKNITMQEKRTDFYKTYSVTLADIVDKLNKNSINLFAEHLLVEVGIKKGGANDVKSATEVMEDFWAAKGMDVGGLSINDGSGLSHYNYISSKQLVFVLKYMYKNSSSYDVFYNSLPVSGENGTLKYLCRNTAAHGKIHAKSGTIRGVRCYAGYTVSNSGRQIAFAILFNNYTCSSSKSKEKMEEFMIALVSLDL